MRTMWNALRGGATAQDRLAVILEGDRRDGEPIPGPGERFFKGITQIGAAIMRRRAELPACEAAVRAFHRVFVPAWDELRAVDGSPWSLTEALTDENLEAALSRFAADKGVSVDEFSLNHLRLMPAEVRRVYYEGLRRCVKERTYPGEWRQVLFVLLKKPGRDPRFVDGRREIALLCQGFKLLTQVACLHSYKQMAGRIDPVQMGWGTHAGPLDPAITLGLAIQQSARLKMPLFVLYIDIEKCFPNARIAAVHVVEEWYGLPADVRQLSRDILEQLVGRYDTEHGLSDEFNILEGVLMGCTESPDKLRLLLNSIAAAICVACNGMRLWGDTSRAVRRVAQALLADDWVGLFESDEDRYKAFRMWNDWSRAFGMPLGVDDLDKSVLSAIAYDAHDKPFNPPHKTYTTYTALHIYIYIYYD